MKKWTFLIVTLLLAVPTLGAVNINCYEEDIGIARIEYSVSGESSKVRAFALDVSINENLAIIADVNDYSGGDGNKYGIFPGTIDLTDLNDIKWGTPVAPNDAPGAEGTGIGTSRVILEMGSLYEPNLSGPSDSGTLYKLYLDNVDTDPCCHISFQIDNIRGGVVLESGASVGITSTGCDVLLVPDCWTWPGQCHGDCYGNDLKVNIDDFYLFKDSFGYSYPHANYDPCADFDRDGNVDIDDFYIFKDSFIVTDVPGDCPPGGVWPPE